MGNLFTKSQPQTPVSKAEESKQQDEQKPEVAEDAQLQQEPETAIEETPTFAAEQCVVSAPETEAPPPEAEHVTTLKPEVAESAEVAKEQHQSEPAAAVAVASAHETVQSTAEKLQAQAPPKPEPEPLVEVNHPHDDDVISPKPEVDRPDVDDISVGVAQLEIKSGEVHPVKPEVSSPAADCHSKPEVDSAIDDELEVAGGSTDDQLVESEAA